MTQRSTLDFLKTEAASGVILGGAALLAIVAANSPWSALYYAFVHAPITVQAGAFSETLSVVDWVKEGLMAIFFFVVGLEIKFEVVKGELANPRRLALPLLAAVGGMAAPALVYLALNGLGGPVPAGWAIPAATDIAFALAALAAVSRGLPASLRIFLLTLAIADDLGAIILIGLLFTHDLRPWELAGAGVTLLAMAMLGRWRRAPYLFYALGFLVVWGFVLKSGVNTSLAGVAAAMTIPASGRRHGEEGVLRHFLHGLHGYVAFAILPLFAFVAAGFSLSGLSLGQILAPVPLGIAAGLVLGKPLGIFGAALLAVTLGLARKPTGATWLEVFGVSVLCGVGFTMSLYIGALAVPDAASALQGQVRLGVVAGTLLSALLGMAVLALAGQRRARRDPYTLNV